MDYGGPEIFVFLFIFGIGGIGGMGGMRWDWIGWDGMGWDGMGCP